MSNNKQSMKLYTEEQIRNAMRADFILDEEIDNLINKLTPIELPSDEEIYIEAQSKKDNIKKLPFDSASFQFGAMWLKDKIQGGNK
jgi:hypothetical protein